MQKEYGSDFHFIDFFGNQTSPSIQEIYPASNLFFSGRSALYNLIQKGIKIYDWQKVYLPEYYCHDVDAFINTLPISICYYNDGPYNTTQLDLNTFDESTNVFVHVNYFGFNSSSRLTLKNAFIIEDHTHNLASGWALNSTAHYCFSSLRKSLPVPAGGIIWSPKKLELPETPAEKELSNTTVYMKLSAMLLKKAYLEAGHVNKQDFRNLFINSEAFFEKHETDGTLPLVIQTEINKIPVQTLRAHRMNNYKHVCSAILNKEIIWHQQQAEQICPFGLILYFDDQKTRDGMKAYLIDNKIYPAVLWPNQKEKEAIDFSAKSLFIHCDIRYNSDDMKTLAETINNYEYAN